MKTINYEVADATIELAYNPKTLEENAIDEGKVAKGLIGVLDDLSQVLGMQCDVTEEVGEVNDEKTWKLHVRYQQGSDSGGAEKEMERMIFLETLADFESQILQEEDVVHTKGVRFNIQVAEHNKVEFQLYQMEMSEPYVEKEEPSKFAGDAIFYFWLNMDKVFESFNRDQEKMDEYLNLVRQSFQGDLQKITPNGAVMEDQLELEDQLWGVKLRITKYQMTDLGAFVYGIKQLYSEMCKNLKSFEDASEVKLEVSNHMKPMFNNMHFNSIMQH